MSRPTPLVIHVPEETTAIALGADAVAAAIRSRIDAGQLDATLVRTGSRGAFFLEPLLELDAGHGRIGIANATVDDVAQLFAPDAAPPERHPRCLGHVDALPWFAGQTRLTFARAGKVAPLDIAGWRSLGGGAGLARALTLDADAAIDEVRTSGLRGRGGAAFPAHVKWRTVADAAEPTRYIVCNADEGDSGTFADRLLMECDPFQLLEGMAIAGCVLGATRGFLYVRSEYPRAIAVLTRALEIARADGLLGPRVLGSERAFDIELRVGAGAYICGEETALLESIEGRRGTVRAKPPVPAVSGLFGKPTLVHNVLSLAAITTILAHGGAAYASHGSGRSRGTMPFQLGGALRQGGLVELPFGLPLRELVSRFGGGAEDGHRLVAAQVGGPLGAYLPPSAWDVALDYEAFAARGAMLGHGGIVAFDERVDMAAQAEFALRFCAHESCGKCTPCRIGSTRGAELVAAMRMAPEPGQRELLDELLETLELGSLCALGGLTPMPVRSILNHFPDALAPPRR